MGNGDHFRWAFPLTCLQIGDLRSYFSHLSIFLALESNKFYILVDNRPWLEGLASRPAHLWQLMVTKSRLSPFANTRARRWKKEKEEHTQKICSKSSESVWKNTDKWFSVIDAAILSETQALLPMKKLKYSLQLNDELQHTLFGLIIFEVSWDSVRGINYFNELQTDTSMAIETKLMKRWEFDSITQAVSCMESWFSGTHHELKKFKKYLLSTVGEIFYDVEEGFSGAVIDDDEITNSYDGSIENESHCRDGNNSEIYHATEDDVVKPFHTPPLGVPYKRRKVATPNGDREEAEACKGNTDSSENSENNIEASDNKDILILCRFSDAELPFKLRDIIMSELRLLTLLEAGLPSWVIFLQSYPLLCNIYRPWMCPLARFLYVLISLITVLIGFYDLYKNVPLLKATASHLFGPLFDWIETWEMVSRIKYLGTMLFLHNCQKALKGFMAMTHAIRSFCTVLARPVIGPFFEVLNILFPLWSMVFQAADRLGDVVWIIVDSCQDLVEMILSPIWLLLSFVWRIATTVILPIFWVLSKVLYAPIQLILGLANILAYPFTLLYKMIQDVWMFTKGISQIASVSEASVAYEPSIWRSLWKDLFSKVFRALRSILNGLLAFFVACNRHRLSIYNHIKEFIRRVSAQQSGSLDTEPHIGHTRRSQSAVERRKPSLHADIASQSIKSKATSASSLKYRSLTDLHHTK